MAGIGYSHIVELKEGKKKALKEQVNFDGRHFRHLRRSLIFEYRYAVATEVSVSSGSNNIRSHVENINY